ncbi:hypothetical protein [Prescottella equi]|uniref:hypothetical protein n=1 Tax=Rhodococcus hoagii TaxID=43767 RepID=UPI0009BF92F2|nr:hypothetical protein [Prescottella equi]
MASRRVRRVKNLSAERRLIERLRASNPDKVLAARLDEVERELDREEAVDSEDATRHCSV